MCDFVTADLMAVSYFGLTYTLYRLSLIFVLTLLWSSEDSLLSVGKTRFVLLVVAGAQVI